MILSTLIRNYVCRECWGNVKMHRDGETGEWTVVCADDAGHRGLWRKATTEMVVRRARLEGLEIMRDTELREVLPWLPRREEVTAEQALEELFS